MDVSAMSSWTIDPKSQRTVLLLNLDASVVCEFDAALYTSARIAFDQLVLDPTFVGSVSATCADESGSGSYLWTGTAQPSGVAANGGRATTAPAPIELTAADLQTSPSDLRKSELITIVPDSSVTNEANAMLVENMKWAFSQSGDESGWVAEFFGEEPPALPTDRMELVKRSLSWYQDNFGKAYVGWTFANYSGANAPGVQLNDEQKLKLKYYLQTGMAKETDFTTQQNGIYLQAYVAALPRLQAYIADGGEKWAKEVYDVITSPAQLTLMVNRIYGAAGTPGTMEPANNFATLLRAGYSITEGFMV